MRRFCSRDLTGHKGVHNILKELKGKKKKSPAKTSLPSKVIF